MEGTVPSARDLPERRFRSRWGPVRPAILSTFARRGQGDASRQGSHAPPRARRRPRGGRRRGARRRRQPEHSWFWERPFPSAPSFTASDLATPDIRLADERRVDDEPAVLAADPDHRRQHQEPQGRLAHTSLGSVYRGQVLGRGAAASSGRAFSTSPRATMTCSPSRSRRRLDRLWVAQVRQPQPEDHRPSAVAGSTAALRSVKVSSTSASSTARCVALRSGRRARSLWTNQLVQWQKGATITGAPLYVDGMIYHRLRGRRLRHPPRSCKADGREDGRAGVWRFYTIPGPGDPGGETWPKCSQAYLRGGASIWPTPAVDPEGRDDVLRDRQRRQRLVGRQSHGQEPLLLVDRGARPQDRAS